VQRRIVLARTLILLSGFKSRRRAGNFIWPALLFFVMGMFNNLMSKIFGHAAPAPASDGNPVTSPVAPSGTISAAPTPSASTSAPAAATPPAPTAAAAPAVDVAAILDGLAANNSEKLDWKKSIVDLMKLIGMDSSLAARKELAADLHYSGDQNDSAVMNIWLHKEVLKKLAQNGGKVPQELLS
jgi:hypothetical protein